MKLFDIFVKCPISIPKKLHKLNYVIKVMQKSKSNAWRFVTDLKIFFMSEVNTFPIH